MKDPADAIKVRRDFGGITEDAVRLVSPWLPLAVLLAFWAYAWGVATNPPGFYLDEASISYNAYTISIDGHDEHGVAWPLFFQTWDASVAANPAYIYLLAAVFKVFGPSIIAARLLSATVGFAAAVLLGVLVGRATGHRLAGWVVGLTALLTPWLFQVSRLVFEVALFPLVLVLVLLVVQRVHAKRTWSLPEIATLGALLGLLTYTYTIGRLLGPILALGLILFASRSRLPSIIGTWAVFGLAVLPAVVFNIENAGALSARAGLLGYIRPDMSIIDIGAQFLDHVLANVDPRHLLLLGDANIRHHVPVMGSILAASVILAIIGLDRVAHGGYRDPWIRYVIYGLLASLVPASLTIDDFHTLRLVALPIFLLLLVGLGVRRLATGPHGRRVMLGGLVAATVIQAAIFQVGFWRLGPDRGAAFDAAFPGVFEAALATGSTPIYLRDRGDIPGYIEAYWHGALRGLDRATFVRLQAGELPPAGAVVLGTDTNCGACEVLRQDGDYIAYRAGDTSAAGLIPNGDFEVGDGPLGTFGSPVFGWYTSADTALLPGGGQPDGAHLALGHMTDTTTTKQTMSAVVAVAAGTSLSFQALVRGAPANQAGVTVTVALVELNGSREFLDWHTTILELDPTEDWQAEQFAPIQLGPNTAYIHVSVYLEPGGAIGDQVEIDDVVVNPLP